MKLGLVLATALAGQSGNIDFRNFAYPFEKDPDAGSGVRLRWMSNDIQTKVTLVKGRYELEKNGPAGGRTEARTLRSPRYTTAKL
jgi:hypothetical protein